MLAPPNCTSKTRSSRAYKSALPHCIVTRTLLSNVRRVGRGLKAPKNWPGHLFELPMFSQLGLDESQLWFLPSLFAFREEGPEPCPFRCVGRLVAFFIFASLSCLSFGDIGARFIRSSLIRCDRNKLKLGAADRIRIHGFKYSTPGGVRHGFPFLVSPSYDLETVLISSSRRSVSEPDIPSGSRSIERERLAETQFRKKPCAKNPQPAYARHDPYGSRYGVRCRYV